MGKVGVIVTVVVVVDVALAVAVVTKIAPNTSQACHLRRQSNAHFTGPLGKRGRRCDPLCCCFGHRFSGRCKNTIVMDIVTQIN